MDVVTWLNMVLVLTQLLYPLNSCHRKMNEKVQVDPGSVTVGGLNETVPASASLEAANQCHLFFSSMCNFPSICKCLPWVIDGLGQSNHTLHFFKNQITWSWQ
jgi:hypothetical protein